MPSYGAVWAARLQLMRPGNALMAAAGALTGYVLVAPVGTDLDAKDFLGELGWFPAALATALITAFGNVLNDITDLEVDRKAHPERPLPSGTLLPQEAMLFAGLLLALGLWEAFVAAGVATFLFAALNVLLLVGYERWWKRHGLPGNLTVGWLVGSAFLFGALATDKPLADWDLAILLAGMAMLSTVARELLKDLQDVDADRTQRTTFPMQAGASATRLCAAIFVAAAVGLSALAFDASAVSLPILLAADLAFVVSVVAAWRDPKRAQSGLKLTMVLALVAFLAGPFL